MELDKIIIMDGTLEKEIYPLLEINSQNNDFIIYTTTIDKQLIEDNIYVGEITENKIKPVSENILPNFEQLVSEVIEKIKKSPLK